MGSSERTKTRRSDTWFHKAELAAIGLLWSGLVAVTSFSIGGSSQAAKLRSHETDGHPVVATELAGIHTELKNIRDDIREIRTAVNQAN